VRLHFDHDPFLGRFVVAGDYRIHATGEMAAKGPKSVLATTVIGMDFTANRAEVLDNPRFFAFASFKQPIHAAFELFGFGVVKSQPKKALAVVPNNGCAQMGAVAGIRVFFVLRIDHAGRGV
jgi:hypothetical protein